MPHSNDQREGEILLPEQCLNSEAGIGGKTRNLAKLKGAGFNVPDFVALPVTLCVRLYSDGTFNQVLGHEVVAQILAHMQVPMLAVRSSALIEDLGMSSLAGQFHTEIRVSPTLLPSALEKVLDQAHTYLQGDLKQFSIIVQEYIEPDFSGVFFSRDPSGGFGAVLDFHRGTGEELVSGKITPQTLRCQPGHLLLAPPSLLRNSWPDFSADLKQMMTLEELFAGPQDIEWCVRGNKFFLLQCRPITTITADQYSDLLALDHLVPTTLNYYWQKTEISEIAPAPVPFTWDLLGRIYGQGGPVERVYAKHGIKYDATNSFLRLLGNELYVDREVELHSLMPSFSYFSVREGEIRKPHLRFWKGLWITLKNGFRLMFLKCDLAPLTEETRKCLMDSVREPVGLDQTFEAFLIDYRVIFEVNLMAEKALTTLRQAVRQAPVSIPEILSHRWDFVTRLDWEVPNCAEWKGNCLDIADQSHFQGAFQTSTEMPRVKDWWKQIPQWKKPYLEKLIGETIKTMELREYGRFVTVKHINKLRVEILELARKQKWENEDCVYYATLADIAEGRAKEGTCLEARNAYEFNQKHSFPATITNLTNRHKVGMLGVSPGMAKGRLVVLSDTLDREDLTDTILYSKLLTPDLTRFFGRIRAIVSEEGGMLSHLAIMARERKIPVLVGVNLATQKISSGDMIEVNADLGSVRKIS